MHKFVITLVLGAVLVFSAPVALTHAAGTGCKSGYELVTITSQPQSVQPQLHTIDHNGDGLVCHNTGAKGLIYQDNNF